MNHYNFHQNDKKKFQDIVVNLLKWLVSNLLKNYNVTIFFKSIYLSISLSIYLASSEIPTLFHFNYILFPDAVFISISSFPLCHFPFDSFICLVDDHT